MSLIEEVGRQYARALSLRGEVDRQYARALSLRGEVDRQYARALSLTGEAACPRGVFLYKQPCYITDCSCLLEVWCPLLRQEFTGRNALRKMYVGTSVTSEFTRIWNTSFRRSH